MVERQQLKVHNGMIGFERSHWVAGHPPKEGAIATSASAIAVSLPKVADLTTLEADLRSAIVAGVQNGHANGAASGKANGHANGAAADH